MEILWLFNNSKYFSICNRVVLLIVIKLMTKTCYRVETSLCGANLEKYGTKLLSNTVHMYFILYVMGAIKYLGHRCSHNAVFELLKYSFLWLTTHRSSIITGQQVKWLSNFTKAFYRFIKKLYKTQK